MLNVELFLSKFLRKSLIDLPLSVSLTYFWCMGFSLGYVLLLQLISGIVLSLLYVCSESASFASVIDLSSDSVFSNFIRYLHVWGVNCLFLLLHLHIGRSLYYGSYSNKTVVWNVGFILYLLMMAEAFLGYVLPWHQMSYWAATVITSVVQSIPLVGDTLYSYIVGGFGVTGVTLNRAFAAHVVLGLLIGGISLLHVGFLHLSGSNNPLSINTCYADTVSFHSLYSFKDLLVGSSVLFIFCLLSLSLPNSLLDAEGFIEANPMVTPVSIKPEWYFLPFYAILRSFDTKIGGLVSVVVFLLLVWWPSCGLSCGYSVPRQCIFWMMVSLYCILGYLGACHPEYPYLEISKVCSTLLILSLFAYKLPRVNFRFLTRAHSYLRPILENLNWIIKIWGYILSIKGLLSWVWERLKRLLDTERNNESTTNLGSDSNPGKPELESKKKKSTKTSPTNPKPRKKSSASKVLDDNPLMGESLVGDNRVPASRNNSGTNIKEPLLGSNVQAGQTYKPAKSKSQPKGSRKKASKNNTPTSS